MIFLFIRVLGHPLKLLGFGRHEPFHYPKLLVKNQNLPKVLAQQLGPPKGVPRGVGLGTIG
jgi:hypothetical protein